MVTVVVPTSVQINESNKALSIIAPNISSGRSVSTIVPCASMAKCNKRIINKLIWYLKEYNFRVSLTSDLLLTDHHARNIGTNKIFVSVQHHILQQVGAPTPSNHHFEIVGNVLFDCVTKIFIPIIPFERFSLLGITIIPKLNFTILTSVTVLIVEFCNSLKKIVYYNHEMLAKVFRHLRGSDELRHVSKRKISSRLLNLAEVLNFNTTDKKSESKLIVSIRNYVQRETEISNRVVIQCIRNRKWHFRNNFVGLKKSFLANLWKFDMTASNVSQFTERLLHLIRIKYWIGLRA